jgi:outer membrane protein assembly factor BamD (BamD/ComL family)
VRTRALLVAAALALAGGCVGRPHFLQPAAQRSWPATYAAAQLSADRGDWNEADRLLSEFARAHPNTSQATEAGYWRAVYKLDPANKGANTRDALAALDAYLASPDAVHHGEAMTFRHLAVQLQSLDRALAQQPDAPASSTAASKSRDEEVQKLRDELQATKDELDRIKRRLAAPTKP